MKKGRVILYILLAFVLLLVLGVFVFHLQDRIVKLIKKKPNLTPLLTRADSEIALGYYIKAEELLNKAIDSAYSREQLLRVLKRGYFLYTNTGNKSFWVDLCRIAWNKVQSNEITLLYTYALLETHSYGRAMKILSDLKFSNKSQQLSYLRDLLLVNLAVKAGYEVHGIKNKNLTSLYNAMKNPTEISAATMESIGREYSNAILLDSALMWAKNGSITRAYQIVEREIEDLPGIKELKIYLSYDAGEFKSTLNYIEKYLATVNPNRIDLILLRADTLLQLGRLSEASTIYKGIVKNNPNYSWTPYYNLAKIDEIHGDISGAIRILERGVHIFQKSKPLVLYLINLYLSTGNTTGAKLLIQSYREKFSGDSLFALMDLQLNISKYSPVRYSAELWNLFNENQTNDTIARYLFIYLYEVNDYRGAKEVLDRFVQTTGGKNIPWVLHFYGLISAARGAYERAKQELEKSFGYENNWEVLYNLALIDIWIKDYGDALNSYDRLLAQLGNPDFQTPGFNKKQILSKIRYYRATIYYQRGKLDLCRRELKYSLELDKTNTKSILLLRKVNLEANSK